MHSAKGETYINLFDHGGNIWEIAETQGCSAEDILDLSSNVAPIDPSIFQIIQPKLLSVLPEPHSKTLCETYAKALCYQNDIVTAGSGTTELIDHICRYFKNAKTLILQPTYSDYEKFATIHTHDIEHISSTWDNEYLFDLKSYTDRITCSDLVFICNPNNPTGKLIPKEDIQHILSRCPKTTFVLDESYMPFTDESQSMCNHVFPNLIVLRSFSKICGIPGVRLGFMITKNQSLSKAVQAGMSEWSVNTLAQSIGKHLIPKSYHSLKDTLMRTKETVLKDLSSISHINILNSNTHFFLIDTQLLAQDVVQYLLKHRIYVRDCSNFRNIPNTTIRISIKHEKEMGRFCRCFKQLFREMK